MVRALLPLALCALLEAVAAPRASAAGVRFLQLIATEYPSGATLPQEAMPPAADTSFVPRAGLPAGATVLSAARAASGAIWAVTDRGAFRWRSGHWAPLTGPARYKPLQPAVNQDTIITAVASDADGHIWAASNFGLYVTDGGDWWQPIDRRDGMPCEDMTCLCLAPNGDVWGGTSEGAWRLRNGQFRYFWGKRWLPGNKVRRIWADAHGSVWLATDGGEARIEERPMTLAEKAAHFDQITQQRHNRRGYIFETHLLSPGDPQKGFHYIASDNDGSWTSAYLAAMCFRYAVTRDAQARAQAYQCMEAMLNLTRLSGIPGYPARSEVTDDELKAGVEGVDFSETVRVPGETAKIWYRSPVDKHVWCKSDTSSDEIANHFFALYLYFDLVANEKEKREISGVLKSIMDHLIRNGYNLVDRTGKPTRWGVYAPELIDDTLQWADQRPLNSLELLSHLKVTAYVTGDAQYETRYEDLIRRNHYLLNTLLYRRGGFALWQNINYSDDGLAYISYFPLLRLEKDPARRRLILQSLAGTWLKTMEPTAMPHNRLPFFNFVYGSGTGEPCDVEAAVQTLEDWPWDMTFWSVRNSRRTDVTRRVAQGLNNSNEITRSLPVSERRQQRWNGDPYEADSGDAGTGEDDGGAWLVSYWMGVYLGYIPGP